MNGSRTAVVIALNTLLVRDAIKGAITQESTLYVHGEARSLSMLLSIPPPPERWILVLSDVLRGLKSFGDLSRLLGPGSKARLVVMVRADIAAEAMAQVMAIRPHAVVSGEMHLDDLVAVLKLVSRGMTMFPAEHVISREGAMRRSGDGRALAPLSEKERQTLQLLAEGCSEKLVALKLGIGTRTVHTYLERVRAKLGASNRVQAVAMAVAAHHIVTDGAVFRD